MQRRIAYLLGLEKYKAFPLTLKWPRGEDFRVRLCVLLDSARDSLLVQTVVKQRGYFIIRSGPKDGQSPTIPLTSLD